MIEIEIYCYITGFLMWNVSKKTGYIVGNKKSSGKICIRNMRNKRKSIFARVIIRHSGWKKIAKKTGKIIVKKAYRWINWRKFRKSITTGKFVHFRSTIDTSMVLWLSLLDNFIQKAWNQVLHKFNSCSRRVRDSRWWGSLTMFPARNKATVFSPINRHSKRQTPLIKGQCYFHQPNSGQSLIKNFLKGRQVISRHSN